MGLWIVWIGSVDFLAFDQSRTFGDFEDLFQSSGGLPRLIPTLWRLGQDPRRPSGVWRGDRSGLRYFEHVSSLPNVSLPIWDLIDGLASVFIMSDYC